MNVHNVNTDNTLPFTYLSLNYDFFNRYLLYYMKNENKKSGNETYKLLQGFPSSNIRHFVNRKICICIFFLRNLHLELLHVSYYTTNICIARSNLFQRKNISYL